MHLLVQLHLEFPHKFQKRGFFRNPRPIFEQRPCVPTKKEHPPNYLDYSPKCLIKNQNETDFSIPLKVGISNFYFLVKNFPYPR